MEISKISAYTRVCLYAPVVGAVMGVCSGISARIWNGVPADFKLSAKVVEPLHPFVNSMMQDLFKGPGKYFIALAPITFLIGKALFKSYQEKSSTPFKERCLSYESIFTISLLALTLLFVLTQACWLPVLATIGPDFGDLSGHVLTVIGFTSIFSMGMQAMVKEANDKQKILASLFSILPGMASWTFLFNTTHSYHNLIESCAALGFAMGLFAMSDWIAKFETKRSSSIFM